MITSYLKDLNNSQKLAIISLVLSICKNHFFRKEYY